MTGPPAPASPTGTAALPARATGPGEPASLRVEFEELSLESEPTFITDFVFYPGSEDFLALDKAGRLLRFRSGEQGATLLSTRAGGGRLRQARLRRHLAGFRARLRAKATSSTSARA